MTANTNQSTEIVPIKNTKSDMRGKNRETVYPNNLRKAVEKFGAEHVAETLGFTVSGIEHMIAKRKCQKVTEYAAKTMLHPNDKSELVMVSCPKSEIELLTRLLDGMNFKYRRFVQDL